MAPKKANKKSNESINARLALVMRSGKYVLVTSRLSRHSEMERVSWSSLLTILLPSVSPRLSIMLCWPRLVSIILLETTIPWEPPVESTSVFALFPSQTLETLTSSEPCQELEKLVNKSQKKCVYFMFRIDG